jgi:flagellar motility protein MotE (MotC chaperone)
MLRRMDERQVGKILLTLDTKRAARLTQALAR